MMHKIEALDKLLKDELSATEAKETNQQALDKLRENAEWESEYLIPIYGNHKDAFSNLRGKSVNWGKLTRGAREPWEIR
jgi:hypothetical protein